jgi:type IV secretory pathway VirB10-like protein
MYQQRSQQYLLTVDEDRMLQAKIRTPMSLGARLTPKQMLNQCHQNDLARTKLTMQGQKPFNAPNQTRKRNADGTFSSSSSSSSSLAPSPSPSPSPAAAAALPPPPLPDSSPEAKQVVQTLKYLARKEREEYIRLKLRRDEYEDFLLRKRNERLEKQEKKKQQRQQQAQEGVLGMERGQEKKKAKRDFYGVEGGGGEEGEMMMMMNDDER